MCVQLGNFVWSEECLGLTVGDLVFIKHSNRLRGAVRLCLPLNTILKGEIKLLFFINFVMVLFNFPSSTIFFCLSLILSLSLSLYLSL